MTDKNNKKPIVAKKSVIAGVIALVAFSVIAVSGFGVVAFAQTSFWQMAAQSFGHALADKTEIPDNFGAFTTSATNLTDVNITNDLVVDGNINTETSFGIGTLSETGVVTDGLIAKLKVIDVNATSSGTAINPEGVTVWVYDASVRQQTASSTLSGGSYSIGTTSGSIITQELRGTCPRNEAKCGEVSILKTGSITTQVVGSTYFKADFEGTDTRDASGSRFLVPVLAGEYFACVASSTPAANDTYSGQAVQCQIHYYVVKD